MKDERTTCADCAGQIPVEALLCRYCGAVQPDSDLPVGGPLAARDWVVAGLILVIVAITSLILIDLQMGSSLTRSGDTCAAAEGLPCEGEP